MKMGLKIGPNNWEQVLQEVTPECCEVWFRLDWREKFSELFAAVHAQNIPFGVHFWAVAQNGLEPNLAITEGGLADETAELIRQTIDVASEQGAHYVNIHPGALRRKKIDFENSRMIVLDETSLSEEEAKENLVQYLPRLEAYAREKKVLLLWETLPRHENIHWYPKPEDRQIQITDNLSPEVVQWIANQGCFVTNDFGHTLSSWPGLSEEELIANLFDTTKQLASQTRLIHLNTVATPWVGTDTHNGILPVDFSQGVLPTERQCKELLQIFAEREDVWVVLEPTIETMIENYHQLIEWKNQGFSLDQ